MPLLTYFKCKWIKKIGRVKNNHVKIHVLIVAMPQAKLEKLYAGLSFKFPK